MPGIVCERRAPRKKATEGGFFFGAVQLTCWQRQQVPKRLQQQQRLQQRLQQRQMLVQQRQMLVQRAQRPVLVRAQEPALLFYHRRPKQQQRSRRPG